MSALAPIPAAVQRRRSATVLVALPLLAALLGTVLALALRDGSPRSPARVAAAPAGPVLAAGDLRLTLPDGWTPAVKRPAIPGFDRPGAAFARTWSADLAVALLPPATPSLLPSELDRMRDSHAGPSVARLGDVRAYHYIIALRTDPYLVVDVYVAPTTRGVATIACASRESALGDCDLGLSALRVARSAFLPLSANAAFLERLPAVVADLNARRTPLRARLAGAASSEGAARAADRLAAAHAAAASALRPLVATGTAPSTTLRAIEREQAGYARLADALRALDADAFARAARAIRRADARLASELAGWQRALQRAG